MPAGSMRVGRCNPSPVLPAEAQGAEQLHELGELVVCVEAARIGKHPDVGALEALRLLSYGCCLEPEAVAVGADAEECDDFGTVLPDFCRELQPAGGEFRRLDFIGCGRGA